MSVEVPYTPADEVLRSILASAAELIGAEQGFVLVARGQTILEIAGCWGLQPAQVMDQVLGRAAQAVQRVLRQREPACADARGRLLPMMDDFFESNSPCILCLPLDLGLRQGGVLCLLHQRTPRRVNELDWEILQALADQAALAVGAASHQTALWQLEASLARLAPA